MSTLEVKVTFNFTGTVILRIQLVDSWSILMRKQSRCMAFAINLLKLESRISSIKTLYLTLKRRKWFQKISSSWNSNTSIIEDIEKRSMIDQSIGRSWISMATSNNCHSAFPLTCQSFILLSTGSVPWSLWKAKKRRTKTKKAKMISKKRMIKMPTKRMISNPSFCC